MFDQLSPQNQSQLSFQESDQRINKRGWNCDSKPFDHHKSELVDIFFDDIFDHSTFQHGHVNGQECTNHQSQCMQT